ATVDVNIRTVNHRKTGRGINVVVLPSIRANVRPDMGRMQLEHNSSDNDFDLNQFSNSSQYTVAHEFGHTIDITDEYVGWTGFFAPSIQNDVSAIMNEGNDIRPRHYQPFGDMLSLAILGCRYNPNGIREPERENPVFRASTLSGLTTYQDGLRFSGPDSRSSLGMNYDMRVSNERILGIFYPQIGAISLINPTTGDQNYGLTAGLRLGQIAHPLVVNLRTGIVTNPSNPSNSVSIPLNVQLGLRTGEFEFGLHYTPVFDILNPSQVTHLFGLGLRTP
ncbi:MAG: hypothetical protein ACRCVT_15695, partial [Leadbetterella sp.]